MSDKKILVGDMSRETAIGILKLMLEAMEVYDSIAPTPQRKNAVQMAISSLETDEAYQLEYEQRELGCKKCKWWKDSDGKYRRGCEAESRCPINTHAVYQGEGYCYMFEPQESEDTE